MRGELRCDPAGARFVLGGDPVGIVGGVVAGTLLIAAGLWWFRDLLQLAVMPGMSYLKTNPARTKIGKVDEYCSSATGSSPTCCGASSARPEVWAVTG